MSFTGSRVGWSGPLLLTLLVALLLGDALFAAIHVGAFRAGELGALPQWNLEVDRSYPEIIQYAKWAGVTLCSAVLLLRRKEPVYAALALLFAYFLLDDSFTLHENAGWQISPFFGRGRTWRLRPQDFGELVAVVAAAGVLAAILFAAYRRSGTPATRAFVGRIALLVGALVFCGVGLDMLHSALMAGVTGRTALNPVLVVLEDGGEMAVASVIFHGFVRHAVEEALGSSTRSQLHGARIDASAS